MAISYPLSLPSTENLTEITLNMADAVAISESPFTFEQETQDWGGEKWTGQITLSDMSGADAAQWRGFLASLHGMLGTFLAGDLSYEGKRGTAASATVSGFANESTVTVAMTGTLLLGDMFQLGSGADATLHTVAADASGNGNLEIWPGLRKQRTNTSMVLTDPRGLFRLATNSRGYAVRPGKFVSVSIPIQEAV